MIKKYLNLSPDPFPYFSFFTNFYFNINVYCSTLTVFSSRSVQKKVYSAKTYVNKSHTLGKLTTDYFFNGIEHRQNRTPLLLNTANIEHRKEMKGGVS